MLLEGKCFKFFCEFFYGVFKVGLNTQQNSPATHCCAIQNSIAKLDLNSAEIALKKSVPVFQRNPGRFGPIFGVRRFGLIYLYWENMQDN